MKMRKVWNFIKPNFTLYWLLGVMVVLLAIAIAFFDKNLWLQNQARAVALEMEGPRAK